MWQRPVERLAWTRRKQVQSLNLQTPKHLFDERPRNALASLARIAEQVRQIPLHEPVSKVLRATAGQLGEVRVTWRAVPLAAITLTAAPAVISLRLASVRCVICPPGAIVTVTVPPGKRAVK